MYSFCPAASMSILGRIINKSDSLHGSDEAGASLPSYHIFWYKFLTRYTLSFFQVGDWKNHLTEAQIKAFKEWTLKHLEGSDFPYYRNYE